MRLFIFLALLFVLCGARSTTSPPEDASYELRDRMVSALLEADLQEILSLARNGANPNQMIIQITPLSIAIELGDADALNELLHLGADPNIEDSRNGFLDEAVSANRPDIVDILLAHGGRHQWDDALLLACREGHLSVVEIMVGKYNLPILNNENTVAINPILMAIKSDQEKVLEYLLSKTDFGVVHTSILWAIYYFALEIATDPNIWTVVADSGMLAFLTDVEGSTPLMLESATGYSFRVELLVNAGLDVNAQDDHGNTALHLAVAFPATVHFLIEAGADINIANCLGQTPLLKALDLASLLVVDMLINAGADINHQDKYCRSPLMIAASLPRTTEATETFLKILQNPKTDIEALDILLKDAESRCTSLVFQELFKQERKFRKTALILLAAAATDTGSIISRETLPSDIFNEIMQKLISLNRNQK